MGMQCRACVAMIRGAYKRRRRLHKKCRPVGGPEDESQGECGESLAIVEIPDQRGRG